MRLRSRRPRSTPISDRWLESVAWAEVRRLRVRRESKRKREGRARKFRSDRKVARRRTRFVLIAVRVALRARGDHPIGQTQLIRLDKLWRRPERVRSFVDH